MSDTVRWRRQTLQEDAHLVATEFTRVFLFWQDRLRARPDSSVQPAEFI
jgi:hypothetical protein